MAEREPRTTKIDVGALARVEGEGALHVSVRGDTVEDVRLDLGVAGLLTCTASAHAPSRWANPL